MRTTLVALLLASTFPGIAFADDIVTIESLAHDFEAVEIRTEKVADGLYVLFGLGGNIAVSVGPQGVLIVDDMFPDLHPKILSAIEAIGGEGGVDFAINTHWHFDHAEGNLAFGAAGSWIVAQSESRQKLVSGALFDTGSTRYRQAPYPLAGQAVISFEDKISFHLNGTDIDIVHLGPAHTAGDAVVIFREQRAVHMGDVFTRTGYPFIDSDNGGGIDGMIAFCEAILADVGPDATIIPGHGEITNGAALAEFVEMLKTVRERVAADVAAGRSLEEIVASKPTADLDARFRQQSSVEDFLDRVHASLAR
jgi:glyoxylase-like metal-dependent hydrolase (beta-lactamase superfamily II)